MNANNPNSQSTLNPTSSHNIHLDDVAICAEQTLEWLETLIIQASIELDRTPNYTSKAQTFLDIAHYVSITQRDYFTSIVEK